MHELDGALRRPKNVQLKDIKKEVVYATTSKTCGGGGRGRTDTGLLPADFESAASAISPHRHI